MASPDLIIKEGDTRDWVFTLSDSSSVAINLTSARVKFNLRRHEWHASDLFYRDTDGTGSDLIAIGTPASDGQVSITPTTADWVGLSDSTGVFVGEFWISDQNNDVQITQDVVVRVDGAMI